MCLQWCHVRSQIINNDHPCFHCPGAIRYAREQEDCSTCRHFAGRTCALTKAPIPDRRTCCHHNSEITRLEVLDLTADNIHPMQLIFHDVPDLEALFWLVESAPEPQVVRPGVVRVRMEDLALPLVYGQPASTEAEGAWR
ncbi:MAG TPA: hypothetical protein PLV64_21825 [Anaerolineales bacterium]|jgi:hypothetical protein|nr:hypothetical protein [Anaerolineales bacterium]